MVIIQTKPLEKKGIDDVTSREPRLELQRDPLTMSRGTDVFSCGIMDAADTWRDIGRHCGHHPQPVGTSLESLWDRLPGREEPAALVGLIRDLSLCERSSPSASPSAPPSKRHCRSLSCWEEVGGWRPQGSRLWTTVEKRRCHSGGSVHRTAAFPAMQRSSSFSLPSRANSSTFPCFNFSFLASPSTSCSSSSSCSGEQDEMCPSALRAPSAASSPDSTPELGRRAGVGGLSRSRSQPCVLNDIKIGMKRRRPEDTQEQRPSLDLTKMTQKLRNFHSLSCPGFTEADCEPSSPTPCAFWSSGLVITSHLDSAVRQGSRDDSTSEEAGFDPEDLGAAFEPCGSNACQLGGELDIEQIEKN